MLQDGSTMVIEAAKGGHTQVVKLLLEYPNRMLMNTQQDLPQVTANDSHLVEVRHTELSGIYQLACWRKNNWSV